MEHRLSARVIDRIRPLLLPLAWMILPLSFLAFVTVIAGIWKVDDKIGALLTAMVLLFSAFQYLVDAYQLVEDDGAESTDRS